MRLLPAGRPSLPPPPLPLPPLLLHPAVILVWEEVWDLPHEAALSSWLLLLITAGAMIGSWFFERRLWCRCGCGVGGQARLALLAQHRMPSLPL